ncbi:hypothetical protein IJI28_02495, partial [Candidatus Saccharibacteria bacterium]|nr:hypothetical protein [Candidatus Saccharibacteria bacterium]
NEYTKVAHKNSNTDMAESTGGVKLTTTYAAYISKTQPADTYSGQVIYTLVHPANADAPLPAGRISVNYNANGSTFTGGTTTNNVVYAVEPMYIATTPEVVETSNLTNGVKNVSYTSDDHVLQTKTFSGASKVKVVVDYGLTNEASITVVGGTWGGWNDGAPIGTCYSIDTRNEGGNTTGTRTYIINSDTVTIELWTYNEAISGYDYGMYAKFYPIYTTEQSGTEESEEYYNANVDTGTYATTTNWYGSWYGDIDGEHYDFLNEAEIANFLVENTSILGGTTIDLYRSLTFDEAYTKANKTQTGGYYSQQDLNKNICQTVAMGQNSTVKDIRDNNTYMIGRLKDGNCWMLDNLALDPTDATTAANMNESNTNATNEAIDNLLHGGSTTVGWSSVAVANVTTNFFNDGLMQPRINNASKDTLVTSYGPASTNGQAKVGIYYNFCAASASTYCYDNYSGIDVPDTLIDAPQDLCPANWRMPTGKSNGESYELTRKYGSTATETNSFQYNLSTPLSGYYYGSSASGQGGHGSWWSSTFEAKNLMSALDAYPSQAVLIGTGRNGGRSMRCIVGV